MGDWYKRDGAAETPDMHLSALDFDILWIKLPTVSVLPSRVTGNAPDQLGDRVIRDGNQCIAAALRSRHGVLLFGRTASIRGPDNVRLLRKCGLPAVIVLGLQLGFVMPLRSCQGGHVLGPLH